VTDERDTIVAIEAAGRYSGLVGGAYEGASGFRAKPGGLLPCAGFGSKVLELATGSIPALVRELAGLRC
jgi:hypothetical protein